MVTALAVAARVKDNAVGVTAPVAVMSLLFNLDPLLPINDAEVLLMRAVPLLDT